MSDVGCSQRFWILLDFSSIRPVFFWPCGKSRQGPYSHFPCYRREQLKSSTEHCLEDLFQKIFNTTFKTLELPVPSLSWTQLFLKWHLTPHYLLFLKGTWRHLNFLGSTSCSAVQAGFVRYCAIARSGCKITIFQCEFREKIRLSLEEGNLKINVPFNCFYFLKWLTNEKATLFLMWVLVNHILKQKEKNHRPIIFSPSSFALLWDYKVL